MLLIPSDVVPLTG